MPAKFEYRVCQVQHAHLTYVDGDWAGSLPPSADQTLDFCPDLYAYLKEVGEEGWELVSVANQHIAPGTNFQILYFKREKTL